MQRIAARLLIFPVLALGTILGAEGAPTGAKAAASADARDRTPVLVELFTSEGCSSCPPADQLLARLLKTQPVSNVRIIALAEHVDYWDRLGWKDRFSSPLMSARQTEYGRALGTRRIYTPQMVVDGQYELVGSSGHQARQAIARAGRAAKARLTLAWAPPATALEGSSLALTVRVEDLPADISEELELNLAVTEDALQTQVGRGENAGKLLLHQAVVRNFQGIGTVNPSKSRSFSRDVPVDVDPAWRRDHLQVVVFLQEHDSRRVVGASAIPLE